METFFLENLSRRAIKGLSLDAGDAKISINGGAFVNLTNLPVTRRVDSIIFDLDLTAAEDVVGAEIRIEDQTVPEEWLPISITIEESVVSELERTGGLIAGIAAVQPSNAPTVNAAGQITTSNPASGGGSAHTPQDVAAVILANPANPIATNASGSVTTSNPSTGGTGSAHTAQDVADLIVAGQPIVTDANGAVTTSNPSTGGTGSNHTAADVAALILASPTNLLATNAAGEVTTAGGTGLSAADITAIANALLANPTNPIATDANGAVVASNAGTGGSVDLSNVPQYGDTQIVDGRSFTLNKGA